MKSLLKKSTKLKDLFIIFRVSLLKLGKLENNHLDLKERSHKKIPFLRLLILKEKKKKKKRNTISEGINFFFNIFTMIKSKDIIQEHGRN